MSKSAAKHQNSNNGLVAAAFAVWAVALLVAFFTYRGSDVGQLGKLIGNLGGGAIGGSGIVDSLVGLLVAACILICWFGAGWIAEYSTSPRAENRSKILKLVTRIAAGAAVWSLLWFFFGILGAYTSYVAIVFTVSGVLYTIGNSRAREVIVNLRFLARPKSIDSLSLLLIATPIALALFGALAPPVAKDTLLYHFALPKAFIAQHGSSFIEGNIPSYLALGAEMHNVWAMLLGGMSSPRAAEAAAGATSFLFFPLLLLAVYSGAREINLDRRWSLLAALMVASIPTAFYVASSAYIDLGLALYVTLAIFALGRWWREQKTRDLMLIVIFLGAALSIKLTSVFVFAAFALIILLRARNEKDKAGKIILSGFASLILAGVIASPWYLRTWNATGSPVFPFYMSIWKGEAAGWDVERSNLFQAMNSQYGGAEKGVLDYAAAPVRLSITAQPELAEHYDGVLGVAFLLGLPLLVWAFWKLELPVEVKIGSGVAGIMFLFWLFSSEQLRYLLPIVPMLGIAIVASAEAIAKQLSDSFRLATGGSIAAAAVAGILVSVAWFLQIAPLRVVLGGESRDEYLARNLDYYPYYQWLNSESDPDAKVWLIDMRRDTYDLNRPVFSDYLFEDRTFSRMVWEVRSVRELRERASAMGIKYVLARHDFLFDYDRSPIVDDKIGRDENEARLKIAKGFILDPVDMIRSDSKFSLIKVF
jgi:hypothetical protein